jgi:hypothetical protein
MRSWQLIFEHNEQEITSIVNKSNECISSPKLAHEKGCHNLGDNNEAKVTPNDIRGRLLSGMAPMAPMAPMAFLNIVEQRIEPKGPEFCSEIRKARTELGVIADSPQMGSLQNEDFQNRCQDFPSSLGELCSLKMVQWPGTDKVHGGAFSRCAP